MARLLLLTNTLAPSAEVLPALGLLSHHVRILPAEASALVDAPPCDVVVVDARRELATARSLCRMIRTTGASAPLVVVVTEGNDPSGLAYIAPYSVRLRGRVLDLTYKEFELLKHLAQHPGRVFTRSQLLQEVWGYDYFGGTRTVDVHVRRLRAKLGTDYEVLIGTVRNVGYRFVPETAETAEAAEAEVTS